ncbi:MAG: hypothetical protein R2788_20820 [Saprospiraceae bacterium]
MNKIYFQSIFHARAFFSSMVSQNEKYQYGPQQVNGKDGGNSVDE